MVGIRRLSVSEKVDTREAVRLIGVCAARVKVVDLSSAIPAGYGTDVAVLSFDRRVSPLVLFVGCVEDL